MLKIHLRDPKIPRTSIHFLTRLEDRQLTDDPSQVTCKRCQKMIKAGSDKKV